MKTLEKYYKDETYTVSLIDNLKRQDLSDEENANLNNYAGTVGIVTSEDGVWKIIVSVERANFFDRKHSFHFTYVHKDDGSQHEYWEGGQFISDWLEYDRFIHMFNQFNIFREKYSLIKKINTFVQGGNK